MSETREPQMTSESTDRAWTSVPNQNSLLGGDRAGLSGWQMGERSQRLARSGAKIAIRTKNSRMARPAMPIVFCRYCFHTRRIASFRRWRAIALGSVRSSVTAS